MVRYCGVYGCLENGATNKERRFYKFPSDERRCRHWIKAVGRTDLEIKDVNTLNKFYFVCDLHFAESDCLKRNLKRNAVPTLLLPQLEEPSKYTQSKYTQTDIELTACSSCKSKISAQCDPSTSQSSQSTQTIKILSEDMCDLQIPSTSHSCQSTQTTKILSEDTPRKRKLLTELKSETKKRKLLESQIKNVTDVENSNMPRLLKKIIEVQKVLKRNSKGNRYDQEYLTFALNIYFASPVSYRIFSEIISLPSIRTLQRRVDFGISTKFDEKVIKWLESKIRKLSESEKYCIICADEMSLKRHLYYQINKDKVIGFHEINEKQTREIATQAFVVMARGIFSNWKQPLAYCFLSQSKNYAELNTWLDNIIGKMIEIGYHVCALTTDQGSNFINMAKQKFVSTDQPFFFVNGKKIYYIFDVPGLIKSLRNNLINYNFNYHDTEQVDESEQVASWDDVQRTYEVEKRQNFKVAFKLTESHVKPNNFEKMRFYYATQVLSRTVAVTINTLVETGKLPEKSMGTAKFIALINDTFDILNSSSMSDDYKYKKAFYHADFQIKTLEKVQHVLSGLRVINRQNNKDVTNSMKFIKGFLISIKAISSLASDLKNAGYDYLFTQRLDKDALENFFGKVRPQSGNCREPTPIQFHTAFKKLFIANIIRHSKYANCAEDLDQLLMSVDDAVSLSRSRENVSTGPVDSSVGSLQVGTSDYKFEFPEENAFTYVCGYLLKKCFDLHKDCEIMKNYVESNERVDEKIFTYFKAYKTDYPFGALINPPEDFKQYIKQIDNICEDHFVNGGFYHLGNEVMTKIKETAFDLPCPCFPLQFLKKLFVRFRIFNLMQQNNKNFRVKSFKRKYFSVSHLCK